MSRRRLSQRFQPGDKVEIFGLQCHTRYEGKRGIVDQCVHDGVYLRVEGERHVIHCLHENVRLAIEVKR